MTGQHWAPGSAAQSRRGRHRAEQSHSAASVWLGTGAIALGVGAALTAGSGVASADSGPTTKIRTTLSAQTVTSADPTADLDTGAKPQSFVSDKQSVVRQQNPAEIGTIDNNNPGPDPTLTQKLLGEGGDDGSGLGIPGLNAPNIPFIELGGGGGGGLLGKIAHALGL